MSSIYKKIESWQKQGFLEAHQAEQILAFEAGKKRFFSPVVILMFLGLFSIGCGIVALISSNWYQISPLFKLVALFSFMSFVSLKTIKYKDEHKDLYEACLFFNMLLFFAMIGLVGQIYHLKSDSYKAFLFWSGLSFPLLFLTKRVFFGYLWVPIFSCAVLASPLGNAIFDFFEDVLFFTPLYASFFSFILYVSLKNIHKAEVFLDPVRLGLRFCMVACLFPISNYNALHSPFSSEYLVFHLICVFLAFLFAWSVWEKASLTPAQRKAMIAVVCGYVLGFLMPAAPLPVQFFLQVFILFSLWYTAFVFSLEKVVRLLSIVIALRILGGFFELFGSLLQTGFGLIFMGVVILAVSYGCYKVNAFLKVSLKGEKQ